MMLMMPWEYPKDSREAGRAGGVTNFDIADLPYYEKAVAEFGDSDLFISDEPMPPKTTGYCLRDRQDRRDLSKFWRIFWRIREEATNATA